MMMVFRQTLPGWFGRARIARIAATGLLAFAIAITGMPATQWAGVSVVHAQDREPGLLELLFNRQKREERARQQQQRQQQRAAPRRATQPAKRSTRRTTRQAPRQNNRQRARPSVASAPIAPSEPAVEKSEDARKVLVVGDFVANGLARGLVDAFADTANVVIERRTNGSSGFVRDDFYDWPAEIGAIMDDVQPAVLVVQLGANDRQPLRIDGRTQSALSDVWRTEYTARIDAFINEARQRGAVLVWAGAPPFRFRSMSADMLALNEIYRTQTEAAGGFFVDIWDGFVDADGNFIERGADIKGQTVRLRGSDGINFSPAGQRKIAFYVERQLLQVLGSAALPAITSLGPDNVPIMRLPPLQTEAELDRVNPIALTDPDFDGGNVLLGDVTASEGAAAPNPLQAKSVRQRLVEDGTPPPAREGRAGNFTLPPDQSARAPETGPAVELGNTLQ